ncbi:MAG: DUF192 domain-containing protein [Candidatus Paceibacterota bacterium]
MIFRKKKILIFTSLFAGIFLLLFLYQLGIFSEKVTPQYKYTDAEVSIRDAVFSVHVADTPEEQVQGLSFQESLPEYSGVWFAFDSPSPRGFWMKDMLFPIDIIWLNSAMQVVHVEHSLTPDTYPQTFAPPVSAQFVLEIRAGLAEREGIVVGDSASITFR